MFKTISKIAQTLKLKSFVINVLIFIIGIILFRIIQFALLTILQYVFHIENDFFRDPDRLVNLSFPVLIIFGGIIGPIFEEMIHRNPLKEFYYKDFILSFAFFFIYSSMGKQFLTTLDVLDIRWQRLGIGLLFLILYGFFRKNDSSFSNKKVQIGLIILFNLLFAIQHFIPTFKGLQTFSFSTFLNILVAIFPYFAMGLLFTYFRRKDGIVMAIAIHMLNNLMLFSMLQR